MYNLHDTDKKKDAGAPNCGSVKDTGTEIPATTQGDLLEELALASSLLLARAWLACESS